jgi:hypothetical protein
VAGGARFRAGRCQPDMYTTAHRKKVTR